MKKARVTRITILRKNQLIIGTIALMLIAAGYLNYSSNKDSLMATSGLLDAEEIAGIGDAILVSSDSVIEQEELNTEKNLNSIEGTDLNTVGITSEQKSERGNVEKESNIVETSNLENKDKKDDKTNYFTQSRLERQTMYSQMIEEYNKILQNSNIGNEQKAISQNEIIKLNNSQNGIMIAENLIKMKGFEDVVIFSNRDSVDIIIKAKELSPEQIAQIQSIVCREMGVKIENIHISMK